MIGDSHLLDCSGLAKLEWSEMLSEAKSHLFHEILPTINRSQMKEIEG